MRKEKAFTRTVTTTTVKVIGIKLDTKEVQVRDIVLDDKYSNDSKILDRAKKENNDKNFAIASVESVEYTDGLYECTLKEFLSVAHLIDHR